MKKFTLVSLVLIVSFALVSMASAAPLSKAAGFVKFNEENNNAYGAAFDASGRVSSISANDAAFYNAHGYKAGLDPKKAAAEFLSKNGRVFDIDNASALRVVSVDRTDKIYHVLFAHFIGDKKVLDSEVSVHVNFQGQVVAVNNSFVPVQAVSRLVDPVVSAAEAIAIAKKHVKSTAERAKPVATSAFVSKNGKAVNAYRVEIQSQEPLADFVCVVNGDTGTVIDSMDVMNHAKPAAKKATSGSVYVLNPKRCKVTKEALTNLNAGAKGMVGKWANIVNEDTDPAAPDASGNYVFDPDNTHFDEVNAYYHINVIHDFYKEKYGFTGLDRAIEVTVHYGDNYDNAFFSPMSGSIAFGDGNRLNDLSKEESVIYHEYTHAVTGAIVSMPYRAESGAMNEAFSDYFPATITNDPELGEWAMAKMNKPYLRTMVNKAHYPEDIKNEVHYDSIIYAGALWDLRAAVGTDVCDKLVHYSRFYLKGISNQKFTDGVKALISADKEHFRGLNVNKIKSVFEARGIKLAPAVATGDDVRAALRFEALNGSAEAKQALVDMENGNIK